MQDYDWNDLRFVLAIARTGTLAGAARRLGVNETTVARRLGTLESALKTRLFGRSRSGRFEPTEIGRLVVAHCEKIEREHMAMAESVGRLGESLFGVVRISSVAMIANRVLVPNLAECIAAYPDIVVEIVPDERNLNLSRREADLAVRLARPTTGGTKTKARKIGALAFAAFCGTAIPDLEAGELPWIGYDDAHAHLPQARWLARAMADPDLPAACLRVGDAETAREAAASGLGRTLLPLAAASADLRLRRLETEAALPVRDVWLLSHEDLEGNPSVAAVKQWLMGIDWAGHG